MSRVDLVVDGEKVKEAHQWSPDDVKISLDGGDTFPLQTATWRHVVVEVETQRPAERDG